MENEDPKPDNRAAIDGQIQELEWLVGAEDQIGREAQENCQRGLRSSPQSSELEQATVDFDRNHEVCVELEKCWVCPKQLTSGDRILLPCGHHHCRSCFESLLLDGIQDESLFPPRCCKQIPETLIAAEMSRGFMCRYKAKKIEFETRNSDRVYCCNQQCAAFLGAKFLVVKALDRICKQCGTGTCIRCRGAAHTQGKDHNVTCFEGETNQSFADSAHQAGYERCFNCQRLVELNAACNHMACHGRSEFCYVCREWKTCACPHWHKYRLIERAAQTLDRSVGRRTTVAQRQERIMEMARHLYEAQECTHEGLWRRLLNRYIRCEDCGSMQRNLLKCTRCDLLTCQRCRNNRRR